MRHWIPGYLLVGLVSTASAQQVSLGLTSTYHRAGIAGVGSTLDYRWRLGGHLEAIGQLTGMRMWQVRPQRDDGPPTAQERAVNLYFGAFGLGYRTSAHGFHAGLLGGGMCYLGDLAHKRKMEAQFAPGLVLTMGHGIGRRVDVSLDTWLLRSERQEMVALPMPRVAFNLGGK